ncbi:MAG: type II secretion system protein [[Clostridium] innocuum]
MMQWKKPIRNNGGFTLVEMLVAFSCVAVSCVLLMPVVSALQRLQEPVYYSEDRIAIYQLRFLLAQSSRLSLQEQTPFLHLSKKKKQTLEI